MPGSEGCPRAVGKPRSVLAEPEEQLQTLVNGPNLVGGDFSEEPANAAFVHGSHLVRQRPGHLEETAGARAEQRVEGALASLSRNGHHGDQGEALVRHHLGITHQDRGPDSPRFRSQRRTKVHQHNRATVKAQDSFVSQPLPWFHRTGLPPSRWTISAALSSGSDEYENAASSHRVTQNTAKRAPASPPQRRATLPGR